jgi:hypothetical protein
MFLMHRVELKALSALVGYNNPPPRVPNAPCGVESKSPNRFNHLFPDVPNAPCGVESKSPNRFNHLFPDVPNAPCGVESSLRDG